MIDQIADIEVNAISRMGTMEGGDMESSFASELLPSFVKPRMNTIYDLIEQSK